jgi:hypothetical protein
VSLIEHDDVIQTIPANGTDHAFDERILPRRLWRCNHFLDSQALDPSLRGVAIDAISSRNKLRGAVSNGNASTICWAVH